MKIKLNKRKDISYFGNHLKAPCFINYIATDADGCVSGYEFKPELFEDEGEWVCNDGVVLGIGKADLGEINWIDTLIEL